MNIKLNAKILGTLSIIVLSASFVACSTHENNGKEVQNNEGKNFKKIAEGQIKQLATDVLIAIKNKNFERVAGFGLAHSTIRFSPYAFVDTVNDIQLNRTEMSDTQKLHFWGNYDGTGEPINLTLPAYFDKFVYNADFMLNSAVSVNKYQAKGNSANNLKEAYPGCDFVEYYYKGDSTKTDAMDWSCLRLVFKQVADKAYLVGIVHDQWTI